jgi:hypothetical protein
LTRRIDALRLENNELILSPSEAEDQSASAEKLADIIDEQLPRVELTDLLVEIDT